MRRTALRTALCAALLLTSAVAFAADPATETATPVPQETATPAPTPEQEEFVFFNVKTKKFHCASCSSAQKCTKNCSYVERSKALSAGGTACKLCRGTCRR